MLAVLYILMFISFGISFVKLCIPDIRRLFAACSPSKKTAAMIPDIVFLFPAGTIIGMMCVGMFNYYITLILSNFFLGELCKKLGVLITFAVFVILAATNLLKILRDSSDSTGDSPIPAYNNSVGHFIWYAICTLIFTSVSAFLMLYTFRISGSELLVGASVFSDLSPHTAMTSSFGVGFNYPTQYMHFSGDGIQYHFFFYALCGTLQYLGFPIDWAINLPSILVMVCAFLLLGTAAVLFSRRISTFLIAPVLVLFRSSFNFFIELKKCIAAGQTIPSAVKAFILSSEWYDTTPYDKWGIWAINVYPNQRHFMLGMSAILILLILFTPFVRRMFVGMIKATGFSKIKTFIASEEAWTWRKEDPLNPLGIVALASTLAITMPYFHGSALIGALLVLMGMAIVSESRCFYILVALCAVLSAEIQAYIFSGGAGSVVKFRYFPGFVCENRTDLGITQYILIVTGLTIILAFVYALIVLARDLYKDKPIYRSWLFIVFLFPMIFAFNFQVSLEMLANHKFIQFSLILLDILVAGALGELLKLPLKIRDKNDFSEESKHKVTKPVHTALQALAIVMALVLIVPLTATGITEWCVYLNINKSKLIVKTNSELVEWIRENTDPKDVFLTPTWAMDRFYLAGRPAYYGWPYYAWSAGHDTDTRRDIYYWLLTGCGGDINEFRRYCQERGIRYLIDDPSMYSNQYPQGYEYNIEFFAANLTPVAYLTSDYYTIVYRIY